jgi:hypothetical protein
MDARPKLLILLRTNRLIPDENNVVTKHELDAFDCPAYVQYDGNVYEYRIPFGSLSDSVDRYLYTRINPIKI